MFSGFFHVSIDLKHKTLNGPNRTSDASPTDLTLHKGPQTHHSTNKSKAIQDFLFNCDYYVQKLTRNVLGQ